MRRLERREFIAGALVVPVALSIMMPIAGRAAGRDYVYDIEPEKVADGIWQIRGADEGIEVKNGGAIANISVIDSPAGAILVDCGPSLRYGSALKKVAEGLTGKPVIRLFITHLHPDHNFGIGAIGAHKTAALPETIKEMQRDEQGFTDAMYRLLGDWMRGTEPALPKIELASGTEDFGGRKLKLLGLSGHSGADLALLDEQTGTLIAGDLVFYDRAPTTPTADLAKWQQSLAVLLALKPNRIITGHGRLDVSGKLAIAQTADWLTWLEQTLTMAVESGLNMVEAGLLPIPDRFSGMALARYELQRSVAHLYPAIEKRLFPRVDDDN